MFPLIGGPPGIGPLNPRGINTPRGPIAPGMAGAYAQGIRGPPPPGMYCIL